MKSTPPTVALVTGSGRHRVGNVIAQSLAEDGYAIALHYRSSAEAANATTEELRGLGVDYAQGFAIAKPEPVLECLGVEGQAS